MLHRLCGNSMMKNVVIATTMWGLVDEKIGAAREAELRADPQLMKPLLDSGATMVRHDGTLASAQNIVQQFFRMTPQRLRIQRELVDEGKDILETAAGTELDRELAELTARYKREMMDLKKEMKEALSSRDVEMQKDIVEAQREILRKMAEVESERTRLPKDYAREMAKKERTLQEATALLDAETKARFDKQREVEGLRQQLAKQSVQGTSEQHAEARNSVSKQKIRKQRPRANSLGPSPSDTSLLSKLWPRGSVHPAETSEPRSPSSSRRGSSAVQHEHERQQPARIPLPSSPRPMNREPSTRRAQTLPSPELHSDGHVSAAPSKRKPIRRGTTPVW